MNNPYLHTPRLILAPINLAILRALQQGPEAFFDTTSWMLPDRYTEFPESIEYNIELVSSSGQSYPWVGYAVVLKQPAIYIGQGGQVIDHLFMRIHFLKHTELQGAFGIIPCSATGGIKHKSQPEFRLFVFMLFG